MQRSLIVLHFIFLEYTTMKNKLTYFILTLVAFLISFFVYSELQKQSGDISSMNIE